MSELVIIEEFDLDNTIVTVNKDVHETKPNVIALASSNLLPTPSAKVDFDYIGVSVEVAHEAEATAARIRARHRDSIIATGLDLTSIKEKLGHGQFGSWLAHHFNMSERSAQNYMNAANAFKATPIVIDALPAATIYRLAGKGVPSYLLQNVIADIHSGTSLNPKEIEKQIISAKQQERIKRNIDQQKRLETRAWQKEEKNLKKAGKTPEEIAAIRKEWNIAKVKRNRANSAKIVKAEKQKANQENMDTLAISAAKKIKHRFAEKFEDFRNTLIMIDYSAFQKALQNV